MKEIDQMADFWHYLLKLSDENPRWAAEAIGAALKRAAAASANENVHNPIRSA